MKVYVGLGGVALPILNNGTRNRQGCTNLPKIQEPLSTMMCRNGDMKQVLYWDPTIFEWSMNFTIWCFLIIDNEMIRADFMYIIIIESFPASIYVQIVLCPARVISCVHLCITMWCQLPCSVEERQIVDVLSFVLNWWEVIKRQELLMTNGKAAFLWSDLFKSSCHPASACFWQLCHHAQCNAVD